MKSEPYWIHVVTEHPLDEDDELIAQLNKEGIVWHSCSAGQCCEGETNGLALYRINYGLIVIGHVTDDRIEEFRINTADPEWIIEL